MRAVIAQSVLPRGPRAPALVQALNWAVRPAPFMTACQRRYGDVFTLRLAVGSGDAGVVVIADPALARTILREHARALAGAPRAQIAPMFGSSSILLADGDEHLRKRRMMSPPFHGDHLDAYRDLIVDATDREIDTWPVGRAFALRPRMQAITLDVVLGAVFGMDGGRSRDVLRHHLQQLLAMVANPAASLALALPSRIGPIDFHGLLQHRRTKTYAALSKEIARRRADPDLCEREDVLAHLLRARDDRGETMTDAELCDQLVTLLLAGHETTATALAWAFEHLLHEPAALRRVLAEARNPDADGTYLEAVLSESLRLCPPLPVVQRLLTAPLSVGEYQLPRSTVVALCPYLIHRCPEIYPEPQAFQPERFLDHSNEPYPSLSFGGGVRRCLGASFALVQMSIVLQRVFARVRLRRASNRREPIRRRAIVFAPARGARAILEDRQPA
jgi:cytochrome P450 family 135